MSVMYIVFILAMLLVTAAIAAFVWATCSGQFDDIDSPGVRVLIDDESSSNDSGR